MCILWSLWCRYLPLKCCTCQELCWGNSSGSNTTKHFLLQLKVSNIFLFDFKTWFEALDIFSIDGSVTDWVNFKRSVSMTIFLIKVQSPNIWQNFGRFWKYHFFRKKCWDYYLIHCVLQHLFTLTGCTKMIPTFGEIQAHKVLQIMHQNVHSCD